MNYAKLWKIQWFTERAEEYVQLGWWCKASEELDAAIKVYKRGRARGMRLKGKPLITATLHKLAALLDKYAEEWDK